MVHGTQTTKEGERTSEGKAESVANAKLPVDCRDGGDARGHPTD